MKETHVRLWSGLPSPVALWCPLSCPDSEHHLSPSTDSKNTHTHIHTITKNSTQHWSICKANLPHSSRYFQIHHCSILWCSSWHRFNGKCKNCYISWLYLVCINSGFTDVNETQTASLYCNSVTITTIFSIRTSSYLQSKDDVWHWCDTLWYSSLALLSSSSISVCLLRTQPFVLLSGDTCCCARIASSFTILHIHIHTLDRHTALMWCDVMCYSLQHELGNPLTVRLIIKPDTVNTHWQRERDHYKRGDAFLKTTELTDTLHSLHVSLTADIQNDWMIIKRESTETAHIHIPVWWLAYYIFFTFRTLTYSCHCGTVETGPGAEIPGLYWSAPLNSQYLTDSWL